MGKIKKKQTKFQMSDFCDFVPDDPSCQTAPEPEKPEPTSTDGGDAGPKPDGGDKPEDDMDMMKDEKMMDHDDKEMTWEKFDEMAGEYFHPMEANIAYFTVAAGAVLDIVLHSYGGLAIWGTAALTQLLATMGIMVGINMMVWGMLVPTGGMLLELGLAVLGFMAYNQFFA